LITSCVSKRRWVIPYSFKALTDSNQAPEPKHYG